MLVHESTDGHSCFLLPHRPCRYNGMRAHVPRYRTSCAGKEANSPTMANLHVHTMTSPTMANLHVHTMTSPTMANLHVHTMTSPCTCTSRLEGASSLLQGRRCASQTSCHPPTACQRAKVCRRKIDCKVGTSTGSMGGNERKSCESKKSHSMSDLRQILTTKSTIKNQALYIDAFGFPW